MTTYVYRDNSKGHVIIFRCQADTLRDADVLFEATTGINPVKAPHIGCVLE